MNNVEKAQDSYKSRMAQKWKVPVLSVDFISKCVEAGRLLEVDPYVVVGRTASEEFSSGKIVGEYGSVKGASPNYFCTLNVIVTLRGGGV